MRVLRRVLRFPSCVVYSKCNFGQKVRIKPNENVPISLRFMAYGRPLAEILSSNHVVVTRV